MKKDLAFEFLGLAVAKIFLHLNPHDWSGLNVTGYDVDISRAFSASRELGRSG